MAEQNGGTALVTRAEQTARDVSTLSGSSEAFEVGQRMAKALASSNVVPAQYQGNLPNVMVAMEYAHRLGASVLAVMQNLDVIHGRPSLRSTFLIGTVNASGRFSPIRWQFQGKEGTDEWGVRAVAKDLKTGEECRGPLITIGLAKSEGWYQKKGSKWQSTPELMLMYRSAAWWTRLYCPELSLGLHASDEWEDVGPAPAERRTVVAQALDAGDDDNPHTGAATIPDPPAGGAGSEDVLKPLRDELNQALSDAGATHLLNDKEARRKWIHRLVGKTATVDCSEFEIRQLLAAVSTGDTDPDGGQPDAGDGGQGSMPV